MPLQRIAQKNILLSRAYEVKSTNQYVHENVSYNHTYEALQKRTEWLEVRIVLVEQQRPGAYLEEVVGEKERTLYYYACVLSQFRVKRHLEINLGGDLVGAPHTWYLSGQSFIKRLKLV